MKKLLAMLLALAMMLAMVACASAPAKTDESKDAPAADTKTEEKPAESEQGGFEEVSDDNDFPFN